MIIGKELKEYLESKKGSVISVFPINSKIEVSGFLGEVYAEGIVINCYEDVKRDHKMYQLQKDVFVFFSSIDHIDITNDVDSLTP